MVRKKPFMTVGSIATGLGILALLVAVFTGEPDTGVILVIAAVAFLFMVIGLLRGEARQ